MHLHERGGIPDDLLTVREVAALLRVHPDSVRLLARQKKMRYHRVGIRLRFPRSAVVEYVERCTATPLVRKPKQKPKKVRRAA